MRARWRGRSADARDRINAGMIGDMGRAECLAAVAMVVGAQREPVAMLRLLAAQDPALRRLRAVAERLAAGSGLAEALADCRLIRRKDVLQLAGLPPEACAAELQRLAAAKVRRPTGEVLARWFPLWVVMAATGPSLAIALVVLVIAQGTYGGLFPTLNAASWWTRHHPQPGPGATWLIQAGVAAAVALVATGLWWGLRMLIHWLPYAPLVVRRLTIFSAPLERAAACAEMLAALRAGASAQGMLLYRRWGRVTGMRRALALALSEHGDDPVAALVALGVIPLGGDGRADWNRAQAEAARDRDSAAAGLAPWLVGVLVMAGLVGFFAWANGPTLQILALVMYDWPDVVVQAVTMPVAILIGAIVLAQALVELNSVGRWLAGPAVDWPLVADRMARALERREDVVQVMGGLRLVVGGAMRNRLEEAMAKASLHDHPGRLLARTGVVPFAQRQCIGQCEITVLPDLLRSVHRGAGAAWRGVLSQGGASVAAGLVLGILQGWLLRMIMPRFVTIEESVRSPGSSWTAHAVDTALRLSHLATLLSWCGLWVVVTVVVATAIGRRLGWWLAWDGFARQARGLTLRRLLAARADEQAIATGIAALAPGRTQRLQDAAGRGDLPGVLAAAGWPVAGAGELDRALTAAVIASDRRRVRSAATARVLLPFLIAPPVALSCAAVMLSIANIQGGFIDDHRHGPVSWGNGGGTPAMAFLYWFNAGNFAAQGDNAVAAIREGLPDFQPLPVERECEMQGTMPPQPPLPATRPARKTATAAATAPRTAP